MKNILNLHLDKLVFISFFPLVYLLWNSTAAEAYIALVLGYGLWITAVEDKTYYMGKSMKIEIKQKLYFFSDLYSGLFILVTILVYFILTQLNFQNYSEFQLITFGLFSAGLMLRIIDPHLGPYIFDDLKYALNKLPEYNHDYDYISDEDIIMHDMTASFDRDENGYHIINIETQKTYNLSKRHGNESVKENYKKEYFDPERIRNVIRLSNQIF